MKPYFVKNGLVSEQVKTETFENADAVFHSFSADGRKRTRKYSFSNDIALFSEDR